MAKDDEVLATAEASISSHHDEKLTEAIQNASSDDKKKDDKKEPESEASLANFLVRRSLKAMATIFANTPRSVSSALERHSTTA
jgi:hypothetical protein